MNAKLAIALLSGALAASAALNAGNLKRQYDPQATPAPTAVSKEPVGRPQCMLMDTVQLTGEQKRRLANCCMNMSAQRSALEERIARLFTQLDAEIRAAQPNMQKVQQLVDDIEQARADLLEIEINRVVFVRQNLTAEQLERLKGCCGGSGR
jgi:Spy/CpxP family protein refolding chaperone